MFVFVLKFIFHLLEISEGNPLIENSLKEWLSIISHLLQLIDLDLNKIIQRCRLYPKQIVHKVENKLKELHKRRLWGEIPTSSRLSYLKKRIQNGTIH